MNLNPDPDAVCEVCGRFGAFRFETETLCAECYANRGSCCSAEFSGRPPECKRDDSRVATGDGVKPQQCAIDPPRKLKSI